LRSRALQAINGSSEWLTAARVAQITGMSYRQTIDALNALHNEARIARHGRKFTARWGSLQLVQHDPADAAASLLQTYFHANANHRP
jgi:hypothetical protein